MESLLWNGDALSNVKYFLFPTALLCCEQNDSFFSEAQGSIHSIFSWENDWPKSQGSSINQRYIQMSLSHRQCPSVSDKAETLEQGQTFFSVKGQVVNILGLAGWEVKSSIQYYVGNIDIFLLTKFPSSASWCFAAAAHIFYIKTNGCLDFYSSVMIVQTV